MRKFSYLILFVFILIACKEEKKKTNVPSLPKDISTIDSSSSSVTKLESNSVTTIQKEPVENVFEKKVTQTTHKVNSISELWATYKSAKILAAKFISENNLDSLIIYLNIAADAAYELSREDIATWQLNNIGYYSINEFKKRTDYDRRVQQLATIVNLKEKGLHLEETKSIFSDHYKILSNAENYLYKAQLLDNELEKSDRTEIIERNLQFIEWVSNLISDGNRTK